MDVRNTQYEGIISATSMGGGLIDTAGKHYAESLSRMLGRLIKDPVDFHQVQLVVIYQQDSVVSLKGTLLEVVYEFSSNTQFDKLLFETSFEYLTEMTLDQLTTEIAFEDPEFN